MADSTKKKVVAMIPTYNERGNIQDLVNEILQLEINCDISVLIVDDSSPDGTGELAEEMAKQNSRVHALVRKKRRGRGAAGIDGFKAALELDADFVIEMDGDFSHQPRFIPELLRACGNHDLAIGSRFIKGGKDTNRSLLRKFITLLVRKFIRAKFKFPVQDVSSGFRCFRREVLEAVDLEDCISTGPSIVLEILYRVHLLKFTMIEVPITFVDRTKGSTKLNFLILLETLVMALLLKKRLAGFEAKRLT